MFAFVGGCLRRSYQRVGRNSVVWARQAPPCHRSKRTRNGWTERPDERSAQWIPGAAGCEAGSGYGDQCIQETAGGRGTQVHMFVVCFINWIKVINVWNPVSDWPMFSHHWKVSVLVEVNETDWANKKKKEVIIASVPWGTWSRGICMCGICWYWVFFSAVEVFYHEDAIRASTYCRHRG